VIREENPKDLPSLPQSLDHADHMLRTALSGYPRLAADHLLRREMRGKLAKTVGNSIRRLDLEFRKSTPSAEDSEEDGKGKILVRHNAYEALIEIAMNLVGIEGVWAGFSSEERDGVFNHIVETLETWENLEGKNGGVSIASATVEELILNMKKVHGRRDGERA